MTLEFRPTIKKVERVKQTIRIALEVNNESLKGIFEEFADLTDSTVLMAVLPNNFSYTQKFDRSTKKPVQEWIVNPDGTAEMKEIEQTQLDVDGKGNIDIYEVTKKVDKDLIDEYIMKATTIEFPGNINPRDAITRLNKGEDLGEIADSYEMSDAVLLGEIEKARQHFAPFADSWDKIRDEVVFPEESTDKNDESEKTADEESETESADLETETSDSDQDSSSTNEDNPGVDTGAEDDLLGQSDPYGNEPPENEVSESDDQPADEDPEDDPYQ